MKFLSNAVYWSFAYIINCRYAVCKSTLYMNTAQIHAFPCLYGLIRGSLTLLTALTHGQRYIMQNMQ